MGTPHRLNRAVARVRSPRARGRRRVDPGELFGNVRIVTQPIVSVSTGTIMAVEALARFSAGAGTEAVFTSAYASGYGPALEAQCLRAALRLRDDLPESTILTVNVSPNALPYIAGARVWPERLRGVIVEITEQDVDNPLDLTEHLTDLRDRGAAIAIDDVSTGYAGLLRLAQIKPDYVKVDRQVVSGVGDNAAQAAVLEALVTLSHRLGAAVIGEGVEDLADLQALAEFDVDYAQGFAIARPSDTLTALPDDVVDACRASRKRMLRGTATAGHAAARTRDVYAVTASLASAGRRHDLDAALGASAADVGVDIIGVSVLANGENLREIAVTGDALDTNLYALSDFPATAAVMDGAGTIEVQVDDPAGDPAEQAVLRRLGRASLLLVPVHGDDATIGVLEFAHRSHRLWSAQDIAHAQGLAEHLSPVLKRLGVGSVSSVN